MNKHYQWVINRGPYLLKERWQSVWISSCVFGNDDPGRDMTQNKNTESCDWLKLEKKENQDTAQMKWRKETEPHHVYK